MYAGSRQIPGIVAIVDQNRNQINGPTHSIQPVMDELAPKYEAFDWETVEIDGNDMEQVTKALGAAKEAKKPFAIISHTVTGKGVSFMEGDYHWHHGVITDELFLQAMKDLDANVSPAPDDSWMPGGGK